MARQGARTISKYQHIRKRIVLPAGILLMLAALAAAQGASPAQNDLGSQIDAYLARVERERGLDAAVLVARGDEVILRKGYGIADEASHTPFSADTVVGIGSISKQFTAAAILRLVDQGRLSVEDTLGEWLPRVPADKAGITLHQLLTHTSGLTHDHMKSDLEPLTKQDALGHILFSKLRFRPGERYSYSNSGYTLLAAVVEEASGREHDAFLQEEFFDALGMDQTGNWADPRFDALPVSTGYANGESSGPINEIPGPYWTVIGNGGIISTVDDMLTWYKALQGGQVLNAGSTAAMFTSYTTGGGKNINYGYGWEVSERAEQGRLITHNGGGLIGNSIVSDYLDQRLTIIILGNRITYQTLGPIPLVIGLPADETCRAIAAGVASGDLAKLPTATFVIWPYLGSLVGVLVLVVLALSWVRKKARASRRTKR